MAVLLVTAAALAACGGGSGKEDATELLNDGFSTPLRSAQVDLDATLELNTAQGSSGPTRIKATGPFDSSGSKPARYDLDISIRPGGGGQTVSIGFVSTGEKAYAKFEGTAYELSSNLAQAGGGRGLKGVGEKARHWITDPKYEGVDNVAGTKVDHVSGRLDVERAVRDLNTLLQAERKRLGSAAAQIPKLSERDIKSLADVVKSPGMDVYFGRDDHVIRRLDGKLTFHAPRAAQAGLGLTGGSLDLSIKFTHVNQKVQIDAPANARPLSELTKSLGAGALSGGLGGLGGGGTSTAPTAPPSTGSGGGTSTGPSTEAFKKYSDCLDKAKAQDTDALQRCSTLLQP